MKPSLSILPHLLVSAFLAFGTAHAQLQLPRIFSDHMVLQRGEPVPVWGKAEAGEVIAIQLEGHTVRTTADDTGQWSTALPAMVHGGPFTLTVTNGTDTITLADVLVGDVWLASGQSNMEWLLRNTEHAEEAIAAANHPEIRFFTVEKATAIIPQEDLKGGEWVPSNPETARDFSAVAYYFGRSLNQELDVPIGLINASWGGTDIEPWTSWDTMTQLPAYQNIDLHELEKSAAEDKHKQARYLEALQHDRGITEAWFEPETDVSQWRPIEVPSPWERTEIGHADGIAWFRKDFELPATAAGKEAVLHLGPVDDQDFTYINGTFIGSENAWDMPREYVVAPGILKEGTNTLVVKVFDPRAGGGIQGKPEDLFLEVGDERIALAGGWTYRSSVLTTDFGTSNFGPNSSPAQLFNAMVHPFINFNIKGVIWYQGENNAARAYEYRDRFPAMIQDWRQHWGKELPFYWAQLTSFLPESTQPEESSWAELREAQHMTLKLPRTGQAVTIDIGDAKDIHPQNKRDVGERLARIALHDTYNRDIVYSGPVFRKMRVKGSEAILELDHVDGGLTVKDSKYGYVRGFAIAGKDRRFVWAQARIEGDRVIVSHPDIRKPIAVRYAWANNAGDANLFNEAGLPAAPFRTDDWPGITQPAPSN